MQCLSPAGNGISWRPALSGCGPGAYQVFHADEREDKVTVPADNFVKGPLVLVRPNGWYYSIALRKKEDNTYVRYC